MRALALLLISVAARAETIAAVPYLSVGVSDDESTALATALAHATARAVGDRVAPQSSETIPDDCIEDAPCLRALAARLDADTLLFTIATAPADGPLVLSATRADAAGRVLARFQAVVPSDPAGRALALDRMAHALLQAHAAAPMPLSSPPERPRATPRPSRRWLWIAASAVAVGTGLALAATLSDDDSPRTATLPAQTLGSFGPGASGR